MSYVLLLTVFYVGHGKPLQIQIIVNLSMPMNTPLPQKRTAPGISVSYVLLLTENYVEDGKTLHGFRGKFDQMQKVDDYCVYVVLAGLGQITFQSTTFRDLRIPTYRELRTSRKAPANHAIRLHTPPTRFSSGTVAGKLFPTHPPPPTSYIL